MPGAKGARVGEIGQEREKLQAARLVGRWRLLRLAREEVMAERHLA